MATASCSRSTALSASPSASSPAASSASASACACSALGTCLSRNSRTCASGSAPTKPSTGWPSLNSTQNGMLRTPNICSAGRRSRGSSSESSLASLKRPAYSASSFSSTGPSALHGPHHGAQMSSSTGCAIEAVDQLGFEILRRDVDHGCGPDRAVRGKGKEQAASADRCRPFDVRRLLQFKALHRKQHRSAPCRRAARPPRWSAS